jgi:hypothetical protein
MRWRIAIGNSLCAGAGVVVVVVVEVVLVSAVLDAGLASAFESEAEEAVDLASLAAVGAAAEGCEGVGVGVGVGMGAAGNEESLRLPSFSSFFWLSFAVLASFESAEDFESLASEVEAAEVEVEVEVAAGVVSSRR